MDLRQFRTLTAVVETGSFHRAAARLNVAQPALSRQIRELEDELGAKLLIRSARGVTMTVAGEVLYREASQVLRQMDTAAERTRRAADGKFGSLRIAYTSLVAEVRASVKAFAEIRREIPEVNFHLSMINSDHQIDKIVSGEIDVGVLYRRPPMPDELKFCDIRIDRYMLLVHSQHRFADRDSIRMAELRDEPILFGTPHRRPITRREMWNACIKAGFEPNIALEADNEAIGLNLVAEGIAVAFINGSMAQRCPDIAVKYLEIEDFDIPLHLAAVWREDRETGAIRQFVEVLRRHLAS
jgi:DNA-binding transcriptional LysR family regulator